MKVPGSSSFPPGRRRPACLSLSPGKSARRPPRERCWERRCTGCWSVWILPGNRWGILWRIRYGRWRRTEGCWRTRSKESRWRRSENFWVHPSPDAWRWQRRRGVSSWSSPLSWEICRRKFSATDPPPRRCSWCRGLSTSFSRRRTALSCWITRRTGCGRRRN